MRVVVRALIIVVVFILGGILIFDPPPLRLRDVDEVALSVPPARKLDGLRHPIETGLACNRKLESYTSSAFGRPEITVFDWLRRNKGEPPELDVHLEARKRNDTWAVKVDRATNTICYQEPSYVQAGMADAYCGPKIIHEDANRIVAFEDRDFFVVKSVFFDKKTYKLLMTDISEISDTGAWIGYFECY